MVMARFGAGVDAQATVTVTGYSANHSSVKVFYRPVPGAKDYRIYDVTNPGNVKYAGFAYSGPRQRARDRTATSTLSCSPTV